MSSWFSGSLFSVPSFSSVSSPDGFATTSPSLASWCPSVMRFSLFEKSVNELRFCPSPKKILTGFSSPQHTTLGNIIDSEKIYGHERMDTCS